MFHPKNIFENTFRARLKIMKFWLCFVFVCQNDFGYCIQLSYQLELKTVNPDQT